MAALSYTPMSMPVSMIERRSQEWSFRWIKFRLRIIMGNITSSLKKVNTKTGNRPNQSRSPNQLNVRCCAAFRTQPSMSPRRSSPSAIIDVYVQDVSQNTPRGREDESREAMNAPVRAQYGKGCRRQGYIAILGHLDMVQLKAPTIRGALMTSTPIPTARPKEEEANPFARVARPIGFRRWLPIILLVQTYQRGWLLKDLIAGLTLTAVLVPVGMGYAEASGLPAIYGLYSTIVPLVAYAIFGPSRILVLGPDSALAGIIAATITPLAAGNPDRLVALAGLLALLTGALCIVTGLARFGFLTDLLSKPIRYGYLNGVALIVLVGQLPKILGFTPVAAT